MRLANKLLHSQLRNAYQLSSRIGWSIEIACSIVVRINTRAFDVWWKRQQEEKWQYPPLSYVTEFKNCTAIGWGLKDVARDEEKERE